MFHCFPLFWIGDLNYRLTSDLDLGQVKDLLDAGNHLGLLKYDQFRAQQAARKVFVGYQEGPIQFRPSYKVLTIHTFVIPSF